MLSGFMSKWVSLLSCRYDTASMIGRMIAKASPADNGRPFLDFTYRCRL